MKQDAAFYQKLVLRVNWDELIFDVLLLVYAEFFLYKFVTGGRWFVEVLGMNTLLLLSVLFEFYIIWYLGILLREYLGYYKKKFVFILFGIAAVLIIFSLYQGLVANVYNIFNRRDSSMSLILMYLQFGIGMTCGIGFAYTEVKRTWDKPVAVMRAELLKIFVPFGMLFVNVYIANRFLSGAHMKGSMLFLPIAFLITFFEFSIFWLIEKTLKKRITAQPQTSRFDRVFKKLLFPLIVATIFCIWEEIYLWGLITPARDRHETVSATWTIFYLILGGIIPVRLLLMFQPPLRLINLILGAGTLCYFLYSVVMLINRVF